MKIRLMSDLHLEFGRMVWPEMADDKDQILVLAGDTDLGSKVHLALEAWAPKVRAIIVIMGNHEYYGSNFPLLIPRLRNKIKHLDNVYLLDKESVVIDDVAFIGTTLWTNMNNNDTLTMYYAEQMMTDYSKIRTGPPEEPWRRKLRATDTTAMHIQQKIFVFEEIIARKKEGLKTVVVTHHVPSYLAISDYWKKKTGAHNLNGAYVSELFEDIADTKPDLWFYGHTHDSMDIMIADTRAVCNPRGYDAVEPNINFDPRLVIEL